VGICGPTQVAAAAFVFLCGNGRPSGKTGGRWVKADGKQLSADRGLRNAGSPVHIGNFGQREQLSEIMVALSTAGHRTMIGRFLPPGRSGARLPEPTGRGRAFRRGVFRRACAAGRGPAVAGAAAAAVLAVAGCAGQPRVALPRKPDAAVGQAALTVPRQTARQRVIAAYDGYWQAYAQGMTSRGAAAARSILARYLTPELVRGTVRSYRADWAAHDIAYGGAITHVLSVQIMGSHARLHDCLDLSRLGVQDGRTGRVVPQSFGLPRLNFYITLVRSGGRWLISNMQPVVVPCVP